MTRRRPGERLSSARLCLRALDDRVLPARHSSGARTRTAHLVGFLAPLQEAAVAALAPEGEVSLVVADSRDWQLLCSHPYGLPFTRDLPGSSVVVAAADYPERLKRRFDDLVLAAAKAGAAPGPVSELLDLLVGHEWGRAAANRAGLRTGLRWLDELVGTYLLAVALLETGGDAGRALLERWARAQSAAVAGEVGPLDAFEYPRSRMSMAAMLSFQGAFTLLALELAPRRGWELPLALRDLLGTEGVDPAEALSRVEPGLGAWLSER